ncbi:MAG: protein phosphatase CheZ [Nitrospiraceae bacterium]|nr:protein phosphatase CheZ [Nitrospiraceae bacterium]
MATRTTASNGLPKAQSILDPGGAPIDTQIYDQLGELARFIDTTLKTITQFRDPMSATTEQLTESANHLRDLKRLTEDGTHKVMQVVETLQDNHRRLVTHLDDVSRAVSAVPGLTDAVATVSAMQQALAEDEKPLVDILTALSFQDLAAQRLNKLVTIVEEVEHRLLELVVVFGPYTKGAGTAEASKTSAMLQQLEASKTTAMNQDLADEILKQFGFN